MFLSEKRKNRKTIFFSFCPSTFFFLFSSHNLSNTCSQWPELCQVIPVSDPVPVPKELHPAGLRSEAALLCKREAGDQLPLGKGKVRKALEGKRVVNGHRNRRKAIHGQDAQRHRRLPELQSWCWSMSWVGRRVIRGTARREAERRDLSFQASRGSLAPDPFCGEDPWVFSSNY